MIKILCFFVTFTASNASVANEIKFIPWSETNHSPRMMLEAFKKTDFSRLQVVTRKFGADVYQNVAPSVVKIVTGDGKFGSEWYLGKTRVEELS